MSLTNGSREGGISWSGAVPAILVAAVSLIIQGIYLYEGYKDPSFAVPIVDSGTYHEAAVRFARGEPLWNDVFWQPPLFPILLGCIYKVCGVHILLAKIILALFAVVSCLLTYRIGASLFGPRIGLIAGLMLAVYGPFVLYRTQLMPAGLATLLTLLALGRWFVCLKAPRWDRWLWFGIVSGLAMITVTNLMVIPFAAFAANACNLIRFRNARRSVAACAFIIAGLALAIAPSAMHNYRRIGEWVFISTNGGINLYIGNNPQRDETLAARPGEAWRKIARRSFVDDRAVGTAEQDRYFRGQVVHYAIHEPQSFLGGLGVKAVQMINSRELPRSIDPNIYRDFSALLSVLMWRVGSLGFPWGIVLPLAVVGIFASGSGAGMDPRGRKCRSAMLATLILYSASIVLFFVRVRDIAFPSFQFS